MRYLTDNFTMQMFENRNYRITTRQIKKSKAIEKCKNAVTSIGSKKIAKLLNKKVGKNRFMLHPGDEVYVVTSKFGRRKSDYKKENTYRFQVFIIQEIIPHQNYF